MAGIRIGGMATGMDTDNTVKTMMKPYVAKVDKVKQDRQYIQWQQDAYRDTIKTFRGFYSKFLDPLSKDFIMSSKSFSSTSATSTNTAIEATTLPGAIKGDYSVNITQVAESAKYSVSKTFTGADQLVGAGTLSFSNGQTVTADATTTVQSLIDDINSKGKDLGIKAQYSQITQSITIETTSTGSSKDMSMITGSTGDLVGVSQIGKDLAGTVTRGGVAYNIPNGTASNTFTVDGVSLKINSTTAPASSIVSVKADVEPTVTKIKAFVEEYNTLVGTMNTKLTEKKQYTYKPLTDEQKKDMKEADITAWETKCKQGIISGDSMISNLMQQMRTSLYSEVTGAGTTLSEVGISTTSDYQGGAGKLVIDEAKLKAALESNSDKVMNLFTKSSSSTDKTTKYNESGIFQRIKTAIYDMTMTSASPLLKKSGYTGTNEYTNALTNKLKDQDALISRLQKDLTTRENRFYAKMAALEKAMNQANAQQASLGQMSGGA